MNAFAKRHAVVAARPNAHAACHFDPANAGEAIPIAARLVSRGIQVLESGAFIRRHAHERQHEARFCCAGEGWTGLAIAPSAGPRASASLGPLRTNCSGYGSIDLETEPIAPNPLIESAALQSLLPYCPCTYIDAHECRRDSGKIQAG